MQHSSLLIYIASYLTTVYGLQALGSSGWDRVNQGAALSEVERLACKAVVAYNGGHLRENDTSGEIWITYLSNTSPARYKW